LAAPARSSNSQSLWNNERSGANASKKHFAGQNSPRVSGRLERNSIPNKDLICGASLLPALALLCAFVTIAHGQSYQGGLRGSLHGNAGDALSNVTLK
jgi:hypothetical protein